MPTPCLFLLADKAALQNPAAVLLLFGAVGMIAFVLLRTSRRINRPLAPVAERPGATSRGRPGHRLDSADEVRRAEVELHEMMREATARLDTKMRALSALTAQAERAAARLESLLALSSGGENRSAAQLASPEQPRAECSAAPSAAGDIVRRTQAERLVRARAQETEKEPGPAPRTTHSAPRATDRRQAEICELARAGLSSAAIADRLGRPRGEVELVLNLRPESLASAPAPESVATPEGSAAPG